MQQRRTSNRGVTLTFLGTRAEIELRSRWHRRHSSLLAQRSSARVMIDCGADWLGLLDRVSPTTIVLTHAHPDHARGLAEGAPCPVYATSDTWKSLTAYPIRDWHIIPLQTPVTIGGFRFEAFPLEHSIRAPAVGYRVSAGTRRFFYAPDLVAIHDRHYALRGIDLYIGDGSTTTRPLVRRRAQTLIGHTPISTQLGWYKKEGFIPRSSRIADRRPSEAMRDSSMPLSVSLEPSAASMRFWPTMDYDFRRAQGGSRYYGLAEYSRRASGTKGRHVGRGHGSGPNQECSTQAWLLCAYLLNKSGRRILSVCTSTSVLMSVNSPPSAISASLSNSISTTLILSSSSANPPPGAMRSAAR